MPDALYVQLGPQHVSHCHLHSNCGQWLTRSFYNAHACQDPLYQDILTEEDQIFLSPQTTPSTSPSLSYPNSDFLWLSSDDFSLTDSDEERYDDAGIFFGF